MSDSDPGRDIIGSIARADIFLAAIFFQPGYLIAGQCLAVDANLEHNPTDVGNGWILQV